MQTALQTNQTNVLPPIVQAVMAFAKTTWPVMIGLLLLFVPTIVTLSQQVWIHNDQAHGPLIVGVVLYLFWIKKELVKSNPSPLSKILGSGLLVTGLLFYVVGRSQAFIPLEVVSALPIISGILLIKSGMRGFRLFAFPVFFLLFMVPLPGSLLDFITLPMKSAVSYVAANILYAFDYPVARAGVIIQISQYKLFVADACAGMHTLISLEILGLLYITLVKSGSLARNAILAILIIPISFTANVIRVMTLILVTYYYGDAVAQGFIHQFSSILLFAVALILIITIDASVQKMIGYTKGRA